MTERLPEPLEDVLGCIRLNNGLGWSIIVSFVLYTTGEFERDDIEYWMPIPEPPEVRR